MGMSVTSDAYLQHAFRVFNRRYFRNRLPGNTVVEWSSEGMGNRIERTHVHGYTRCTKPGCAGSWVRIHPDFHAYGVVAQMSLLHGMVHLKAVLGNRAYLEHGTTFQREMKRLAAIGAFNQLW